MSKSNYPAAFDGQWQTLAPDETRLLGERLYEFNAFSRLRKIKEIRITALPFYSEHLLCDVHTTRLKQPDEWLSCIYGPDGVRVLSGNSSVIHNLNSTTNPDLSDLDVQRAYLKFFCRFVHGGDGPFEIITNPDQIDGTDSPDIVPLKRSSDDEEWSASVHYGASLFKATFKVEADGHVKMIDDIPVAESIARRPDVIFEGASRRLRQPKDS